MNFERINAWGGFGGMQLQTILCRLVTKPSLVQLCLLLPCSRLNTNRFDAILQPPSKLKLEVYDLWFQTKMLEVMLFQMYAGFSYHNSTAQP